MTTHRSHSTLRQRSAGLPSAALLAGLLGLGACHLSILHPNAPDSVQSSFCEDGQYRYCQDFSTLQPEELPAGWIVNDNVQLLESVSRLAKLVDSNHVTRGLPGVRGLSTAPDISAWQLLIPAYDLPEDYRVDFLIVPVAHDESERGRCSGGNEIKIGIGAFEGSWSVSNYFEGAFLRGRGKISVNELSDVSGSDATFHDAWRVSVQRSAGVYRFRAEPAGDAIGAAEVTTELPGSSTVGAIRVSAGSCGMFLLGLGISEA